VLKYRVWRIESAHVIAGLTRITRDLDLAEDRSAHLLKNECLTGLTPILSQNDR
jgi:predicted RNA polymerase sigma factor